MACMTILEQIQQLPFDIAATPQRKIHQPSMAQAGVLIAFTHEAEPHIVLTLRSSKLAKHSGEVAFPGGKQDPEDDSIITTALREAHEEVGLCPSQVEVLGELHQVFSRFGYVVTPVVGIIKADIELVANPDELESIFKVPVRFFIDNEPDEYFQRGSIKMPTYHFEGYRIWGLTAMMIAEMINNHFGGNIEFSV